MPAISLIIPVYNAEKYLWDCLNSVVSQTFKDIEVILVDDCSSDDSIGIATAFIQSYNGPISFKITRHTKNSGAATAKNTGIGIASGRYISFLDSDDYISPLTYERLFDEIENNGKDIWLVASCYSTVNGDRISNWFKAPPQKYVIESSDFAGEFLLKKAPHMNGGKLVRSEVFNSVKFRDGRVNEDWLFALDVFPYVEKYHLKTIVIPDRLYYYRMREGSVSHSSVIPLVKIAFNDLLEAIEIIRETKPELTNAISQEYAFEVFRRTIEARSKYGNLHPEYVAMQDILKTVKYKTISPKLDIKSRISFLLLKHFPKLYDSLKFKGR